MSNRMAVKKGKIHDLACWNPPLYEDDRGQLVETFRADDPQLKGLGFEVKMAYISWTLPGFVRGFHAHPGPEGSYAFAPLKPEGRLFSKVAGQRDCFFFLDGTYRLVLFDARADSPSFGVLQEIFAGEHNRLAVVVPSGVWHAYKNVGPARAFVLNFPDALFKGEGRKQKVDELREENAQPFFEFDFKAVDN
jgi:dTDP-4-dehydrorhamnose 3,5-epimerase